MIIHGQPVLDVNEPGDLHFLNCLHRMEPKAPQCAGVVSGEAKIESVTLDIEIPEKQLRGTVTFERIVCPQSCPRDKESIRKRCLIEDETRHQ